MIQPRLSTVAVAMLAATMSLAADPIRMDARSTFSGPIDDTHVMTVELQNDGPDARGALVVSSDSGPTTYPVELPQGARKRMLVFPKVQWGTIDFTLETNRGRLNRKLPASPLPSMVGGSVALIGDDVGALAFVRRQTEKKQNINARDAYVKPEEAPGRPLAYEGFSTVVLGPGAERIGDETVEALKRFALGGGTLVFLGGASAPILEDLRWQSVLPGRGWKPRTLSQSAWLQKIGGEAVPGAFTVLAPTELAEGAAAYRDNGVVIESQRGLGLGSVVTLGYSPLEQPLNAWPGRARALSRIMRNGSDQRAKQFLQAYRRSSSNDGNSMAYPVGSTVVTSTGPMGTTTTTTYGYPGGPGMATPMGSQMGDPFSTRLPDTTTVFGILGLYFVLVVPVSFLVLRKMKRGELAWITAPVLSLGFAALLFKSAQGLYSSALSSATQGVLVVQEGTPDAMFYGTSQMFFPVGGVYDLKLSGVEDLSGVQNMNEYGYYGPSYYRGSEGEGLEGFNLLDVGEIVAPRLEANNLAFREMSFSQRVQADWFTFERQDGNKIRIENRSPYAFDGTVVNGPVTSASFSLEPGESTVQTLRSGDRIPEGIQIAPQDARNFTRRQGRIALSGKLAGFRPGPQVGKEVRERSGVAVLAFAKETL